MRRKAEFISEPKPRKRKCVIAEQMDLVFDEGKDTYWVPGVNSLKTCGRWASAEFTEVYQIESDFEARVEGEFNQMIENVVPKTTETEIAP